MEGVGVKVDEDYSGEWAAVYNFTPEIDVIIKGEPMKVALTYDEYYDHARNSWTQTARISDGDTKQDIFTMEHVEESSRLDKSYRNDGTKVLNRNGSVATNSGVQQAVEISEAIFASLARRRDSNF